jgi:gas vesicle protein
MKNEMKLILMGVGLLLALALFLSPTTGIVVYAQSQSGNRTSVLSAETQQKLTALADRLRQVVGDSGTNITLPQDGNLTSRLSSLVDSDAFKKLSDRFTQVSEELGINTTNIAQLKQEGGSNLTKLVQKLQDIRDTP